MDIKGKERGRGAKPSMSNGHFKQNQINFTMPPRDQLNVHYPDQPALIHMSGLVQFAELPVYLLDT